MVLKKSLSCSYPDLAFGEALQKENEKLQVELQISQANMDVGQCEVIQHLIGVTEVAADTLPEESLSQKESKKVDSSHSKPKKDAEDAIHQSSVPKENEGFAASRNRSSVSSTCDLLSSTESYGQEEWHSDLLGCCSEPALCLKTFFYPCGTFSRIATVATNRHMSSGEACNELMAYSMILSCCCYTCCVRRKLRKKLNITGGFCDDFLSHLLCCCCALVQEWREVEIRGASYGGPVKTKTNPPPSQNMES